MTLRYFKWHTHHLSLTLIHIQIQVDIQYMSLSWHSTTFLAVNLERIRILIIGIFPLKSWRGVWFGLRLFSNGFIVLGWVFVSHWIDSCIRSLEPGQKLTGETPCWQEEAGGVGRFFELKVPKILKKTYRSSVGTENRVAHILLILASSSQWSRKVWGLTPEKQNGEELEDKSTFGGFFQRGEVVPWSEVCAVGLVVWNLPHKGRSYDFDSSPNLQLWISFLQDLSIVHPGSCGSCGSRWKVEIYAVSRSQCPPNGTWMIQRCKSTWISDLALHVHKEFPSGWKLPLFMILCACFSRWYVTETTYADIVHAHDEECWCLFTCSFFWVADWPHRNQVLAKVSF